MFLFIKYMCKYIYISLSDRKTKTNVNITHQNQEVRERQKYLLDLFFFLYDECTFVYIYRVLCLLRLAIFIVATVINIVPTNNPTKLPPRPPEFAFIFGRLCTGCFFNFFSKCL